MMFDLTSWGQIVSSSELWYSHPEIMPHILSLFGQRNPDNPLTGDERKARSQIVDFFAVRLRRRQVCFGSLGEFYYDQDRWREVGGWQTNIDTVILRRTNAPYRYSYDQLNALSLLEVYCLRYLTEPSFRTGNGELSAISPGHFYAGRETFVPHHFQVWSGGRMLDGGHVQHLDDRYIGLRGDHEINKRSVVIAIAAEDVGHPLSPNALKAIDIIMSRYNTTRLVDEGMSLDF
jgi:hypothetical protein